LNQKGREQLAWSIILHMKSKETMSRQFYQSDMMHFCLLMKQMHCILFICQYLRTRSFQKPFRQDCSHFTIHSRMS
jgi:hypothetical protein